MTFDHFPFGTSIESLIDAFCCWTVKCLSIDILMCFILFYLGTFAGTMTEQSLVFNVQTLYNKTKQKRVK